MTITEQKDKIRGEMHIRRAALNHSYKEQYDTWICEALLKIIKENEFKTIHTYLPIGGEVNIFPLIENLLKENLTVVAPKTLAKRKLKNLILKSLDELADGVYGTQHPAGDNEYLGKYDLIIVPGLAFDADNYRLGYGSGYYDTFMVQYPAARKVGVFYPFQEVDNVPVEEHDLKLDEILVNKTLENQ